MREVNPIRSFVSLFLVFYLLVPIMYGELNTYGLDRGSHFVLIIKKQDKHRQRDTHCPYELNGKEEESRSGKSTNHSPAYTVRESRYVTINQLKHSFVASLSGLMKSVIKTPLYLIQRSLLI